nr:DUF6471 domain-containing protein [uncultured Janthinobacterium sp.]
MQNSTDWRAEARRLLQVELARKEMGYKELSRALEATCEVDIDSKALSNKVGRGTFSFAFFLQCMKALDIKNVTLRD